MTTIWDWWWWLVRQDPVYEGRLLIDPPAAQAMPVALLEDMWDDLRLQIAAQRWRTG